MTATIHRTQSFRYGAYLGRRWASLGVGLVGGLLPLGVVLPAGAAPSSAAQLVATAVADSKAASSVTVAGSVVTNGGTIGIHVTAGSTGAGYGTVRLGRDAVRVILSGSNVYFEAGRGFWLRNEGKTAAQLFANRWVQTAVTTSDGRQLAQLVEANSLMNQIFKFGDGLSATRFRVLGRSTISGQPVTVVEPSNIKGVGRVYISRSSTPYVVRLTGSSNSGAGSVTFSGYNRPVTTSAPKNPIDIDQLGKARAGG